VAPFGAGGASGATDYRKDRDGRPVAVGGEKEEEKGMATRTRATALAAALVTAAALACVGALLAASHEAEAAFPGQNGRIAYVASISDAETNIYSMNPDGTDRKQLTDDSAGDYQPSVSPDGTRIAFMSVRSGINKIYAMNADGTSVRNLSGSFSGDGSPAWSPDGREIAFVYRADVWVMHADGSGRKNLTNTGPVDGYSIAEAEPSWSPDGTKIAFYKRTGHPGNTDLYTIDVGGTGLKQVTDYAGKEYNPDWSPSGHRITFHGYTRASGSRIFTIKPDGTGKRLIASGGSAPAWSPDGKRIAFEREGDLYKVVSDGSGEPSVIAGPAESRDSSANWGPTPTAR